MLSFRVRTFERHDILFFRFIERATFLDLLVPATIMTLLAGHPLLQTHYGDREPNADDDAAPRAATPAQDRLTDSSGSSSEDDAADDEDYVQRSSSDSSSSSSSSASSRSASPAGSSSDDEPVEPQDNLIRQSPYGPTVCDFFYDRLDTRPMSAEVTVPECFRDGSCCAFFGSLEPIRKICSDTRNPTRSTVCSHVGRGAVKDRRVHEMGHFYTFLCLECRVSRRSWSSLVNMPLHKKKHLIKANHTFVAIGAGTQRFNEFRDWLRQYHPRYLDLFELGPGNLVRFKNAARER